MRTYDQDRKITIVDDSRLPMHFVEMLIQLTQSHRSYSASDA